MCDYKFKEVEFNNPSFLFILEDILKSMFGCPLFYNPFIKNFRLIADKNVLVFGCGSGSGAKCIIKFLNEKEHLTCINTSKYWMTKAERRVYNE